MYILLLVAMSTPMVMPTLGQMMPTNTATPKSAEMPTLGQMTPTNTVNPKSAEMPKQVARKISAVKTPKGVYTSLSLSLCGYRCLHLLENFK